MTGLLRQLVLSCLFLFAMHGQAIADALSDARNAYYEGNYAEAEKLFLPLAAQGDATAQFNLGLIV